MGDSVSMRFKKLSHKSLQHTEMRVLDGGHTSDLALVESLHGKPQRHKVEYQVIEKAYTCIVD